MCLDTVNWRNDNPRRGKVVVAYKKFVRSGKGITFVHFPSKGEIPRGVWLQEVAKMTNPEPAYRLGFHAYKTMAEARSQCWDNYHVALPVKFRKVCARGVQDYCDAIVALEMMVPRRKVKSKKRSKKVGRPRTKE